MKKNLFYAGLIALASIPCSLMAQIQKGTTLVNGVVGFSNVASDRDNNSDGYERTKTLAFAPTLGHFVSNDFLLYGGISAGNQNYLIEERGFNGNYVEILNQDTKLTAIALGARYYFRPSGQNQFFLGTDLTYSDFTGFQILYLNGVDDLQNLNLNFYAGVNQRYSKELYIEGKLTANILSPRGDDSNDPSTTTLNLKAGFTNFAAFKPKNASNASDVFKRGTAIIEGEADISKRFANDITSDLLSLTVAPTYLTFVTDKLAVGGGIGLGLIIPEDEEATISLASITPRLRYHFFNDQKVSFYGQAGFDYQTFHINFDDNTFIQDRKSEFITPNLELGADFFVGEGLALEPKITYGRRLNSGDVTANTQFGINVGIKYFLMK